MGTTPVAEQRPDQARALAAEVQRAIGGDALVDAPLVDGGDDVPLLVAALVELAHEGKRDLGVVVEGVGEATHQLGPRHLPGATESPPGRLAEQLLEDLAIEGALEDEDGARQVEERARLSPELLEGPRAGLGQRLQRGAHGAASWSS